VKNFKNMCLCAAVASVFASCTQINYDVYYNSEGLAKGTYIPLAKGERPRLVETMDLPAAIERYKAAGYIVMGNVRKSGMNLRWDELIDYAQSKGASLVLYTALPEGTIEKSYMVPVTNTSTTYHSGSIHSSGLYGRNYNYSGTSTTNTTTWHERRYTVRNYDHILLFLVKKA
jgi:hypothetical protein